MAELKRTFSGGAMNKDLDERLLPNGKYRDALNVQVSTSEGADVGALQNILGNKLPYAASIASNLGSFPKVIGSIRRDETECIYWFVVSNDKNLIIEFNQLNSTLPVKPIVVDTRRVLGFDRENLITGIEILDDFLIWTDDKSEPKMIKITDWRDYTNNAWTHTQVDGGNFEEKHCTVIKEGPTSAPTLKMAKTSREGPIYGTLHGKAFTIFNNDTGSWEQVPNGEYKDQNGDGTADSPLNRPLPNPPDSEIIISGTTPDFRVGDKLEITLEDDTNEGESDQAKVIVSVLAKDEAYPKIFKINIDSVNTDIEEGVQSWRVKLIQKPALFESKFVRFAYRYKYKDGEYSTISPWSQVAFIGDDFDYNHQKGYNLGMVNQLRLLEVRNWAPASITGIYQPYGVVEVDILYKDSVSNNIYVVKSIKTTDEEHNDVGNFLDPYSGRLEIDSELIYKVIPSNQILRPFDNVPKKAKAVSVSGNRLLFGNYTENYDILSDGKEITVKLAVNVSSVNYGTTTAVQSVKSQRTYQLGVVYRDKYGRETPVLTDSTGSVKLNKGFAASANHIKVRITSPIPDWVDTFKYYIRETSQPYYNLAMDRHYPAEDGNVWIAFSSSDRNKIQEDSFVELKKEHDSDSFVEDEAKYKVLAIENEAPDFIRQEYVSKGKLNRDTSKESSDSIFFHSSGYPGESDTFVDIKAPDWKRIYGGNGGETDSAKPVHQLNDLFLVVYNEKNRTKRYEIANIQLLTGGDNNKDSDDFYRINIEKPFSVEDVLFIPEYKDDDGKLSIEIFQKVTKTKPEFKGRFFTKIQRDITIDKSILTRGNAVDYKVVAAQSLVEQGRDITAIPFSYKGWYICNYFYQDSSNPSQGQTWGRFDVPHRGGMVANFFEQHQVQGFGAISGEDYMEIGYNNFGPETRWNSKSEHFNQYKKFEQLEPQQANFVQKLQTVGTKFRFSDDPDGTIYKITNWSKTFLTHDHKGPFRVGGFAVSGFDYKSYMRAIRWTLKLNKPLQWTPDANRLDWDQTVGAGIEIINEFNSEESFTSDNPGIFETEPKEVAELDLYYEASDAYQKSAHGSTQRLFYSNCFSFGNGVESDRIRDDFNAPIVGKGVRVSTVLEEQYKEVRKKSDIIYSGIYNSTSGINNLNQFIQAEQITKSINPSYGSIQLMQFRLGDLDVYLEDNVVKILADRDALFNADGSKNLVATNRVLGAIQPYAGDYGISQNPESYSRYGNRAYFSDKNRGVILRLSGNGLTPISKYGMEDYFRDKLSVSNIKVIGSYDENKDEYNLTLTGGVNSKDNKGEFITLSEYNDTVSFKEDVNGWNTRKSFIQESGLSLNNIYYTFKDGQIWSHNNETRNNFYGTQYESSVKFIFNDAPGSVKSFKTLNYEGSQARVYVDNPDSDNKFSNRLAKSGWWVDTIESDMQEGQVKTFKDKEGKWFYNILGTETVDLVDLDTREYSVQGLGYISAITGSQGEDIEIIVQ